MKRRCRLKDVQVCRDESSSGEQASTTIERIQSIRYLSFYFFDNLHSPTGGSAPRHNDLFDDSDSRVRIWGLKKRSFQFKFNSFFRGRGKRKKKKNVHPTDRNPERCSHTGSGIHSSDCWRFHTHSFLNQKIQRFCFRDGAGRLYIPVWPCSVVGGRLLGS
jgi:hypothetical protein